MLIPYRGQWAIINESRGSEDVLIKREDFSFPKILPTRDVGSPLPTVCCYVIPIYRVQREQASVTTKSKAGGILLLKFHKKKMIPPTKFLYFIIGPAWEKAEDRFLSLHQTFFLLCYVYSHNTFSWFLFASHRLISSFET
jgi:hypothetical protein